MDNNENFTNENVDSFATENVDVVDNTTVNTDSSAKTTSGTAILVLGILSILCCAPCGIVSLVMYLSGKDNIPSEKAGQAKAGFICSIIGIAFWIIGIIYTLITGASLAAILS